MILLLWYHGRQTHKDLWWRFPAMTMTTNLLSPPMMMTWCWQSHDTMWWLYNDVAHRFWLPCVFVQCTHVRIRAHAHTCTQIHGHRHTQTHAYKQRRVATHRYQIALNGIGINMAFQSHTATHCNALQHTHTHCNTRTYTYHGALIGSGMDRTLQSHVTICFDTLQHKETHCNIL